MDKFLERILALETLEKIFRVQVFLTKASLRAREPDLKVINLYLSNAEEVLKGLEPVLTKLHDNYGDLHEERISCMKRITDVFSSIEILHYNLKNIYGDWTIPETYIFVTSLFGCVLKNKDQVSIVLSDMYSFEQSDLSRGTRGILRFYIPITQEKEATPTLFLPKIEYSNPLNWTILAHEMGHALEKPLEDIFSDPKIAGVSSTAEGIKTIENWTTEIWCDLVAAKLLGPSYFASYVVFTLLASTDLMESYKSTHPAHRFRISIMKAFIEKMDLNLQLQCDFLKKLKISDMIHFFDYLFEERCSFEQENFIQSLPPRLQFPIDYQRYRDFLIEKLDILTHEDMPYLKISNEKIKTLTERLSNGILIGSSREFKNDKDSLDRLEELNKIIAENRGKEDQRNKIGTLQEQIGSGVKEEPNNIGEIINAGWKYKYEEIYEKMIDLFFREDEDFSYRYDALKSEIFSLDDKLKKSIEISYIHKLFKEG